MDKLQMAHDFAMKLISVGATNKTEDIIRLGWEYADEMQAEWDEREKAEAKNKWKEFRLEKAQIIATTVQCHKRKRP